MYDKACKMTINTSKLAEDIIGAEVQHHDLPDFIVNDRHLFLTSKFLSSLCYFLSIN